MQSTITINFLSSKNYNDEERLMLSKSDNIKIMISDEADEIFESLKNRYQNNLGSMRNSEFAFDYVKLFYYKCLNQI